MTKDSQCISSRFVENINIFRSSQVTTKFNSCNSASAPEWTAPRLNDEKIFKFILSEINDFESFLSRKKWEYSFSKAEINLRLDDVSLATGKEGQITIYKNELFKKEIIRKKIVLFWVSQVRKNHLKMDSLAEEILSDILVFLVWGDYEKDLLFSDYESFIFSEKSICRSQWRPLILQEFCKTSLLNMGGNGLKENQSILTDWSLRPLFLKSFLENYLNLNIKDKLIFSDSFFSKVISYQIKFKETVLLSNIHELVNGFQKDFFDVSTFILRPFFEKNQNGRHIKKNFQSLYYVRNGVLLNPLNGSYYQTSAMSVSTIHIHDFSDIHELLKYKINPRYVIISNNWRLHFQSVLLAAKIAQIPASKWKFDNLNWVQEVVGWNPLLKLDRGY